MRITVSNLSIGLVTSPSEESKQLISLLEALGVQVIYHIAPDEIQPVHIENGSLNVWLLNVDDDHWHDNIDQLLDESEASIYFSEPGVLSKQSHPDYWCQKLVSRLHELTGLAEDSLAETETTKKSVNSAEHQTTQLDNVPTDQLGSALDVLETSSIDLPSDIAADLVSELESISPELETSIEKSQALQAELESERNEVTKIDHLQTVKQPPERSSNTVLENASQDDFSDRQDISDELVLESDFSNESLEKPNEFVESGELNVDTSLDEELDFCEETDLGESIELEAIDLDSFDGDLLENTEDLLSFDSENIENAATTETAGIADEIMALAEEQPLDTDEAVLPVNENNPSNSSWDEIDFSNSSIPVLESVRDDDKAILESIYETDEAEQEPETDEIVLAPYDEYQAKENKDTQSSQLKEIDDMSGELSFELADSEQMLTEEDHFVQENISAEENISDVNETIELNDLALTSIEDEAITGRANFLEDEPEPEHVSDEKSSIVEQESEGLALESIKEQVITGRAVFIEEEPEPQTVEIIEPESLDDGGLSLESNGQDPIEGIAKYAIDDQLKESEISEQKISVVEVKPDVDDEPEDDSFGLNLEPIDEQREADWLKDESSQTELIEPELIESESIEVELAQLESSDFELPDLVDQFDETSVNQEEDLSDIEQLDFDIDLLDEVSTTELKELLPAEKENARGAEQVEKLESIGGDLDRQPDNLSVEEIETETLEFEIPMLEESATGLEFEEVVQHSLDENLTPCWVIGASLGGPAAVKRFLQSLPADINASFIVTQHIDENFLPVLAEILTSNSHFDVQVAKGSNPISAGKVYLAPLKGKLIFLKDGSMLVDHSQKWSAPYMPCIDDVIESLSAIYGEKSGAIIFSGMGQDGLNGVKKMLSLNGQVWAQSVDTCANSSMPEAIIDAGLASVVAAPEVLADRLASYLNQS